MNLKFIIITYITSFSSFYFVFSTKNEDLEYDDLNDRISCKPNDFNDTIIFTQQIIELKIFSFTISSKKNVEFYLILLYSRFIV